jgi:multiple sugar transport system substrate-binding protein
MITRRRTVLQGAFALLGATALAPVARAQSDGVRAIFWGGQARAERTFAVFDLFQNKLGTAPVVGEFMGFTDYWPKVATQTAGGNAPDLIQMDYRYIVEYAQRGALTPLDDYLGGALDLADFDADQIEAGKVDGKFYGVSMGAGGFCLQVNASAFERAGLPVPGPTTTYADLLGMAGDFNAANAGMRMLQDGSGNEPALENWLRQRGKALYTAEGELAFETEDAAEWFALWADLRDKQACVTAEEQAISTGTIDTSMLVTGRAASGFTGVNELIAYQALVTDTLAVTNMPLAMAGGKGGQYRKPTMMWTLAQSSKLKDEAVELINFFVRDLEAASLLGLERGIPASAASREHIAGGVTDLERQTLDFFANLGDLLGPIPPSPPSAAGEISQSLLGTLSQEIGFGAKSPEVAAAELVSGAQDILARAG